MQWELSTLIDIDPSTRLAFLVKVNQIFFFWLGGINLYEIF